MYTREQIQALLEGNKKAKAEKATPRPHFSFSDIMESYIDQRIAGLIEEMKPKDGKDAITPVKGQDYFTSQEIQELSDSFKSYIDANTPKKGVHYFDGSSGRDGQNGLDGKDGQNGLDGTTVSLDDVRPLLQELIEDIDLGLPKDKVEDLLKKHSKTINDNFSSRLQNLRSYVELNYGGHGGTPSTGSATQRDVFVATNNQTVFIASKTVKSDIQVSESGTILTPTTDYINTTTTLTLAVGVPAGTVIIWYYNI